MRTTGDTSLYIHLPFCTRKCGYCHFYVVPDQESLKDQLVVGLEREWQRISPQLDSTRLVSIYFGGGTPALFGPERIDRVLSWIRRSSAYRDDIEITLEANPEETNADLLSAYASVGINRLSIGVQSFDDDLLRRLTRRHSAKKAYDIVIAAAKAGIENISIDLMVEIPGQTLAMWQNTIHTAMELPITHLSLYNLTIEPETPFYRRRQTLQRLVPNDDVAREMIEIAQCYFEQQGLLQYEISAFARSGQQSIHNTGYWLGRPFLGLGPSAFSYWSGARWRNCANLDRYCHLLECQQSPIDFHEALTPEASRREHFVLQLRLNQGVDRERFQQKFGVLDSETLNGLEKLQAQGWVTWGEGRWFLTREGRFFYDAVASELI